LDFAPMMALPRYGAEMDRSARERWNERRWDGGFEPFPENPSAWLVEHRELLAGGGRALDVACGDGRNALFLARLGFEVDAIDVSDVAIDALRVAAVDRALPIQPRVVDLEHGPLPQDEYDAVVSFNYLQRDLFGQLERALRPGGLLLFQTFGRAAIDELGEGFNPAYVLDCNELLRAFPGLHVVHYREGGAECSIAGRGVAGIVAQRVN
jgi:SAM-dependent methyltransferase